MSPIPVFLSVVCAVRNQAQELPEALERLTQTLYYLVSDYELIIVDNGSDDETVQLLKELTDSSGYPNIQVFALTKWVEDDVASWAGLENSLGDFAVVTGFDKEQVELIPKMLEKAVDGFDVVIAQNTERERQGLLYRIAGSIFHRLYDLFCDIDLRAQTPDYRHYRWVPVNVFIR